MKNDIVPIEEEQQPSLASYQTNDKVQKPPGPEKAPEHASTTTGDYETRR